MIEEMVYIDENNEVHKIDSELVNSMCKKYETMSITSRLVIATAVAQICKIEKVRFNHE